MNKAQLVTLLLLLLLIFFAAASPRTTPFGSSSAIIAETISVPNNDVPLIFWVRQSYNSKDAARLIHDTKEKLFTVVRYLAQVSDSDIPPKLRAGIKRLVARHFNNINLQELDTARTKTIAYNKDKGSSIHVCLRTCKNCDELGKADRVFLVALHEIAHSAMAGFEPSKNGITEHSDEFSEYETFLFDVAEQLNLFRYRDVVGKHLCGVRLPDTKLQKTIF